MTQDEMKRNAARAAVAPAADAQKKIRAAIDRQLPENIARIQDWIRHPGIAAENWQMEEACTYTMGLIRDAGFQMVKRMPTKGQPGIFATLDAGAKRTVGIYFMYDVKQYDPAEWNAPPLEGRLVDRPGEGLTIVTDMPDSNEGLTETVKLMGHVRPTFFGEYFDVKTHINPTNTAYTAKALELHTDTPAEE